MGEGLPEETRPEWLLDKFESPEAQARAYADAEREMGRMRAEMQQQADQFQSALQNLEALRTEDHTAQQRQSYDNGGDPLLERYQQAVDMGDARAMLTIQMDMQRQITQEALQQGIQDLSGRVERGQEVDREVAITLATERVARSYGEDWEELAPKIGDFLQGHTELIPATSSIEGYEKAISTAARVVQADRIIAGAERNESVRTEKLNTQGLTGGAGRVMSPEESQAEWDKVKNAKLTGYAGLLGG